MADPVVWSIPANGGEPIVESYGYRTDLIPAYTLAEQRIRQRAVPLEALEFGVMALEAREAQLATSLIFASQSQVLIVPFWQYGSRLTANVGIGDQLLPFGDAQECPYRAGGYALVWRDPFTWELFRVFSVGVGGIVTADNAISAWPAGSTLVFPARRAMLPDRGSLKRESTRVMSGRLRFTMEQDEDAIAEIDARIDETISGQDFANSQWAGNNVGEGGFGSTPALHTEIDEDVSDDETSWVRSNGTSGTSRSHYGLNKTIPATINAWKITYRAKRDTAGADTAAEFWFTLYRDDGNGEESTHFNIDDFYTTSWATYETTITFTGVPDHVDVASTLALNVANIGGASRRVLISWLKVVGVNP